MTTETTPVHPVLDCRTCGAEMVIIDVGDLPPTNTCTYPHPRLAAGCMNHDLRKIPVPAQRSQ